MLEGGLEFLRRHCLQDFWQSHLLAGVVLAQPHRRLIIEYEHYVDVRLLGDLGTLLDEVLGALVLGHVLIVAT